MAESHGGEPLGRPAPTPLILGVDTSGSVAVGLARGAEVLQVATVTERMAHVESLVPLVHRCLAAAGVSPQQLTALVVGLGPGPFTGLRVGIVTGQVLAATLGLPWRGVCSLDVLAVQYAAARRPAGPDAASGPDDEHRSPRHESIRPGSGEFVVATDARRREVYWARYDRSGARVDGPYVAAAGAIPRLPTVGPGADLYPDQVEAVPGPRALDPGVLASQGPALPDAGREPLYLRRPDATEPTRRKPVLVTAPPRTFRSRT